MQRRIPEPVDVRHVDFNGARLLYFGGCDYLRFGHLPEVRNAAIESLKNEPSLSIGASRATTGDHQVYRELESQLAILTDSEDALLTGAGYLANLCLIPFLQQSADLLLMDDHCHPSLNDLAHFSGVPTERYRHCDPNSASKLLRKRQKGERCFLLSETMFGLDGSVMPLLEFHEALPVDVCFLLDEAHGLGILNSDFYKTIRNSRVLVKSLSLAKTIGCHGGAIAGPSDLVYSIEQNASIWAGHTPIPIHIARAALKSIEHWSIHPESRIELSLNIKRLSNALSDLRLLSGDPMMTPVCSFSIGTFVNQAESILQESGIFPSIIRYPGSKTQQLLRIAISSKHTNEDIQILKSALSKLKKELQIESFKFR